MQTLINTNNEELIIATENMTLKYKVVYETNNKEITGTSKTDTMDVDTLEITRLDLVPLTQKDYDYIQEAQ